MPQLIVCFFLGLVASLASARPAPSLVPALQQLAPGVYAVIGQNAQPTAQNHGVVGNQGVLIGEDGVVLVDTGTSARYAAQLVAAVKRLTDKPIVLAINTHQHPAFVFGNGTLVSHGVPVLAHRDAAELIERRCQTCLENLQHVLGAAEMRGTRVVAPTRLIDGPLTITAAGRVLDILYYGHSSSPGSIAVIDRASGLLFAGGLVSFGRVPETKDASIENWLHALEDLKKRQPKQLVPGEGPVAPAMRIDELERYLTALQNVVRQTYRRGVGLADAARQSQLPEFRHWPLYESVHNKNVEYLYLQMERAAMDAQ